jgi:NAD(P)-dependent dehydrogenase (short-subunit alcohol dehydrogenase family)
VNLNSITAYNVRPEASAHGKSEFAVLRWTEFLVEENRRVGLIVFSVHPGTIMTKLAEAIPRETWESAFPSSSPLFFS